MYMYPVYVLHVHVHVHVHVHLYEPIIFYTEISTRRLPPLASVSHTSPSPAHQQPPTGKSTPLVPPHQPPHSGGPPSRDRFPSGKTLPMDLNLTGGDEVDGNKLKPPRRSGAKSDDSIEPPITPGGSLSPAVDELIKSLQKAPFRTHHRTGSGGSIASPRTQRRSSANSAGGSGSTHERKIRKMSNPCTPSHGAVSLYASAIDTAAAWSQRTHTSLEILPGHRDNKIPYSKLDSSDSDSDPETFMEQDNTNLSVSTLEPAAPSTYHNAAGSPLTTDTGESVSALPGWNVRYPASLLSVSVNKPQRDRYAALSNNESSSCEVTGTDGHDADSESNYDETESTAEEHYPADSPSPSFSLSPTLTSPSPHPPSSTTFSDQYSNVSPLSSCASPIPELLSSYDTPTTNTPTTNTPTTNTPTTNTPTTNTPRELSPAAELHTSSVDEQTVTISDERERPSSPSNSITSSSSSSHGQVAKLISQFEVGSDASETASAAGLSRNEADFPDSPRLEIPLHIRREQQQHHHLSGSYSPARVEQALSLLHDSQLGNSTSIVRHFFENIGSKGLPEVRMHRTYSHTELEDSGFQVITTPSLSLSLSFLFEGLFHCTVLLV